MDGFVNFWESTTQGIVQSTGHTLRHVGNALVYSGEKVNEVSRTLTGGTLMDPVRDQYHLGFITVRTEMPKRNVSPSSGGSYQGTPRNTSSGEEEEEEARKYSGPGGQRWTEDEAAHIGFVKVVRKKAPRPHFSDGRGQAAQIQASKASHHRKY